MMKKFAFVVLAAITAVAASADAQSRAGIDRPIRVGMFKGMGSNGEVWHTNTHTASSVMAALLANPTQAGLGDSLVIPPAGFNFYSMPVALNPAGTMECSGGGCGPTPEQMVSIVASLDTLDVLIMNSNIRIDVRITDTTHRKAFESFWETKGLVSVHATIDHSGSWPKWGSVNGARFRGHPAEQTGTVRRDSVFAHEPHWQYLNQGLFSNGTDTNFFEEWFFFTTSGADIRAVPHLKPTVNLVEASLANPGNQTPMGDHPMSWYRALPTGGRTFYTAVGHRSQVWQTTRMFRRQLYNAILWTAKYDSLEHAVGLHGERPSRSSAPDLRIATMPGKLSLNVRTNGAHTVELSALDGTQVAVRQGARREHDGETTHEFSGLRIGVYIVTVSGARGRTARLAAIGQ